MALGTFTKAAGVGEGPSQPTFLDVISFLGDSSYPTGGTTGFEALVRALVGDSREILAVWPQDCGGFTPTYVASTDAFKVFRTGAVNTAMEEVPNATDLSSTTFNVLVLSK